MSEEFSNISQLFAAEPVRPVSAKEKRVWDNFCTIAEVQKDHRLKFVVSAATRDGYRCVAIREWYWVQRDQEWKPGRDGIVVPLIGPLKGQFNDDGTIKTVNPMDDLLAAIDAAIKHAATMELSDPDNAVIIRRNDEDSRA